MHIIKIRTIGGDVSLFSVNPSISWNDLVTKYINKEMGSLWRYVFPHRIKFFYFSIKKKDYCELDYDSSYTLDDIFDDIYDQDLTILRKMEIMTRLFKENTNYFKKVKQVGYLDINEFADNFRFEPEYYENKNVVIWVNIVNGFKMYLILTIENGETVTYYSDKPDGILTNECEYRLECLGNN